jgi:molybdopterin synthase catalytic subunit
MDEVRSDRCGAIAGFVGTVRSSAAAPGHEEAEVVSLEYEAHPKLAQQRLAAIGQAATTRWGLENLVAVHRVGVCALGDPTVVIACAAPHRREALEACHWAIDEIKSTVPIWKREVYTDGASWVGPEGERGD